MCRSTGHREETNRGITGHFEQVISDIIPFLILRDGARLPLEVLDWSKRARSRIESLTMGKDKNSIKCLVELRAASDAVEKLVSYLSDQKV